MRLLLLLLSFGAAASTCAQQAAQQMQQAGAPLPSGSPEAVKSGANQRFEGAQPAAVIVPGGQAVQEAGPTPKQSQTVPQTNGQQPVIVIQNQNVNHNEAHANADKAPQNTKGLWWALGIGAAVGAGIGAVAGGVGAGIGALIGAIVGLVVWLWNRQA